MKLTDFIRYLLALLFKGPKSWFGFIKITNKRFCNSTDKIIGWSDGYPSFYILSPPLLSNPASNSMTTRIMSIYQWRKLPDYASIAITDKCNCDCEYCSFTSMKKESKLLSTSELINSIKQAQELGASTINFTGGEPLMNKDITTLIESVDKNLSQAILFTNGFFLKKRAKELKKAGLTSVIVSIDSHIPEKHNSRRGLENLFEKATEGIKEAKKEKLLVGISTVVSREDVEKGNIVKIFELGRKLKVNDILIFDEIPSGNYFEREDLSWEQNELDKIIDICAEYQKRKSFPGIHPYSFSKSHRGVGCAAAVSQFYISPYGEVTPCDFMP